MDAARIPAREARIHLPDIGREERFALKGAVPYTVERDYFRSAVNVMLRHGYTYSNGIEAVVHGEIPINAGTSSSSALIVTWIGMLARLSDQQTIARPGRVRPSRARSGGAGVRRAGRHDGPLLDGVRRGDRHRFPPVDQGQAAPCGAEDVRAGRFTGAEGHEGHPRTGEGPRRGRHAPLAREAAGLLVAFGGGGRPGRVLRRPGRSRSASSCAGRSAIMPSRRRHSDFWTDVTVDHRRGRPAC